MGPLWPRLLRRGRRALVGRVATERKRFADKDGNRE